jgi:hypothetical protein
MDTTHKQVKGRGTNKHACIVSKLACMLSCMHQTTNICIYATRGSVSGCIHVSTPHFKPCKWVGCLHKQELRLLLLAAAIGIYIYAQLIRTHGSATLWYISDVPYISFN